MSPARPRHPGRTSRGARARRRGIGLALAGGGPLGGIYEIGALLALADSLDGLDLNDLDVYVGVSSGGFVAAALANGISPAQMYRLFIDDGADAALKPEVFLKPALGEFRRRASVFPRLAFRAAMHYLRDPFRRGVMRSFSTLASAVPTGMFDNGAIDEFLARVFSAKGRTNDFRKLGRKLYLVATNLDTGLSVTFGQPGHDHVPISRAIEASSALPGLFPPVEIDGDHYVDGALNKTLHASVALDEGIGLLLCVNPLVPFDAPGASRRGRLTVDKLDHGGLPLVLSQTFRAVIHSRMKVGMEKYRRQYPDADVVLFEPDREDVDMFFANIFSYSQRKRLCATAYATTRHNLRARAPQLAATLARHGITIREDRLADAARDVRAALVDPRPIRADPSAKRSVRSTARELAHTLDHLERFLEGRKAPRRGRASAAGRASARRMSRAKASA
ncbi:MAG TPA: patatin-like phospholipase family protein [Casimicrobiaceae bacterium]|nr:patatin-like phospholipase family protein [Casimicrobiaceae bacterium]